MALQAMRLLTFLLGLLALLLTTTATPTGAATVSNIIPAPAPNITTMFDPAHPYANVTNLATAGTCPPKVRYSCGEYMFEDGTRQDFESQAYKCIDPEKMYCHDFRYDPWNPKRPGEKGKMVAAQVYLGCVCFFYEAPCDNSKYTEVWEGWAGWKKLAYTKNEFKGWWCKEHPAATSPP